LSDQSKTVSDSMEETKERHRRYLRAVGNPVRRDILRAIKEGHCTVEALSEATGLDAKSLDWHLKLLEVGLCVERRQGKDGVEFQLTREGLVVDYMDK
jgi:DNA-binding transcriptional ArsR family regulator